MERQKVVYIVQLGQEIRHHEIYHIIKVGRSKQLPQRIKQFATSCFHVALLSHFSENDYSERYLRQYLINSFAIPKQYCLREMFLIHEDQLPEFIKFCKQIDGCLDSSDIDKETEQLNSSYHSSQISIYTDSQETVSTEPIEGSLISYNLRRNNNELVDELLNETTQQTQTTQDQTETVTQTQISSQTSDSDVEMTDLETVNLE